MKTLSGHKAPRFDKEQFHDKMTVSTWTVFDILLLNVVVLTRKKEDEKWHFCNGILLRLAVFRVTFEHLYEPFWP